MASAGFGFDYTLQWRDFRAVETPPPGRRQDATAQTFTDRNLSGGTIIPRGDAGSSSFTVADDFTARVSVNSGSWRLLSASKMSVKEQVWLIKHEQGHYDISALITRDYYWRVRALIGTRFPSKNDLDAAFRAHRAATIDRIGALDIEYDDDTENSRNGEQQWQWWSAFERARQLHRTPLQKNANGQYLRIELIDALRTAHLID